MPEDEGTSVLLIFRPVLVPAEVTQVNFLIIVVNRYFRKRGELGIIRKPHRKKYSGKIIVWGGDIPTAGRPRGIIDKEEVLQQPVFLRQIVSGICETNRPSKTKIRLRDRTNVLPPRQGGLNTGIGYVVKGLNPCWTAWGLRYVGQSGNSKWRELMNGTASFSNEHDGSQNKPVSDIESQAWKPGSPSELLEDQIAHLAQEISRRNGGHSGQSLASWLEAAREILTEDPERPS